MHNIRILVDRFFREEYKRLDASLEDIIFRTCMASNSEMFYALKVGNTTLKRSGYLGPSKILVHNDHLEEALKLVNNFQHVDRIKNRTYQYLLSVTRDCKTIQERRDAIPESIVFMTGCYNDLPRSLPETHAIKDNQSLMKEYLYLKPILEFYSVIGSLGV